MTKNRFFGIMILALAVMMLVPACDGEVKEPVEEEEKPQQITMPEPTVAWSEAKPYETIYFGLFNDQHTTRSYPTADKKGTADVTYSLYIPEHTETRAPLTIVLVPGNTKASEFAESDAGKAWRKEADKRLSAVAFVEAGKDGWNNAEKDDLRDDALAVYAVFKQVNSDSVSGCGANVFYSLDKNRVSLVGYGDAAEAALYAAAEFPAVYCNLTLVDLASFDQDILDAHLDSGCYPYATSRDGGYGSISNRQVPMPVATIDTTGKSKADEAVRAIYDTINAEHSNPDVTEKDELIRTVALAADASVADIYGFTHANGRYLGYPGGTIRENITMDQEGFKLVNDTYEFGGKDVHNRYLVYTPASYDPETPAPLVLVMHGQSAALSDLISESRWSEIADGEENGMVVCFVQGKMGDTDKTVVKPDWFQMIGGEGLKELSVKLRHDLDAVKKAYSIDPSRIYLTGHSAGSMATCMMASTEPGLFTAYAANGGYLGGGQPDGKTVVPFMVSMAEFDGVGASQIAQNADTNAKFLAMNGLRLSDLKPAAVDPVYGNGKYQVSTAAFEGTPLFRYVYVKESPHVFMAEEARMSWDFMKHWTRTEKGSFYDGTLVNPFPAETAKEK